MFDLFGTLVSYYREYSNVGFHRSHEVALSTGAAVDYDQFCAAWAETYLELDAAASKSHAEFSMQTYSTVLLERLSGSTVDPSAVELFRSTYLEEWSTGVEVISGVAEMISELSGHYTLAVVTNTHDDRFARGQLARTGVADLFDVVVTSIGHGMRKPAPAVFRHALELSGGEPDRALFVGDSYEADYCGAVAAGLMCLLIDPDQKHDVPNAHRIDTITDLPSRLEEVA